MLVRIVMIALIGALAACDQIRPAGETSETAPALDAPTQESEDEGRGFQPANDAANTTTGELGVRMTTRIPESEGAAPQDILSLRGANGLIVEAELTGASPPSTLVDGQTLRGLLSLPVEVAQTLVYRVISETKPESGQGLCGAGEAAFVVVWESEDPGAPGLKVLGVMGGAPGAEGARACPMLNYSRS